MELGEVYLHHKLEYTGKIRNQETSRGGGGGGWVGLPVGGTRVFRVDSNAMKYNICDGHNLTNSKRSEDLGL